MTDLSFVCANSVEHRPRPVVPIRHHTLPKSWGGAEVDVVRICGTCHDNAHDLLNWYVRTGGTPSWEVRRHYGVAIRQWCADAWVRRPSDKPPWTTAAGATS